MRPLSTKITIYKQIYDRLNSEYTVVFQAPYVIWHGRREAFYVFNKKDWQVVRKMLMTGTEHFKNQALLLCKHGGAIGFLAQDIIKYDLTWDRKFANRSELMK